TALGQGAAAGFTNSMALGAGAATTRAGQIVIGTGGESGNTYTLSGITNSASAAAQTGSNIYVVTTDANGDLAGTVLLSSLGGGGGLCSEPGAGSLECGDGATATGNNTTALGRGSTAGAEAATSVGENAKSSQFGATSLGASASASGIGAVAIGDGLTAAPTTQNPNPAFIASSAKGF